MATAVLDMEIEATDVSQQKMISVGDIPEDATIGELVQGLVGEMNLPTADGEGRPVVYHALHQQEGRHLRNDERVSDSVRSGERLVLQPNIDAG
jgi:hypothetical protein